MRENIFMRSDEGQVSKSKGSRDKGSTLKIWSRLRVHMTVSYIGVTLVIVLLLEFLLFLLLYFAVVGSPLTDTIAASMTRNTAQAYGLEATLQEKGAALNPSITFQLGQAASIAPTGADQPLWFPYYNNQVPYVTTRTFPFKVEAFALLIGPDGSVLASSYPAVYPPATLAAQELPQRVTAIRRALAGQSSSDVQDTARERVAFAVQPVL